MLREFFKQRIQGGLVRRLNNFKIAAIEQTFGFHRNDMHYLDRFGRWSAGNR